MSMEFKLGDLAALQKLRDSLIRDEMSEERGRRRLEQERWEAFKKTAQGIVESVDGQSLTDLVAGVRRMKNLLRRPSVKKDLARMEASGTGVGVDKEEKPKGSCKCAQCGETIDGYNECVKGALCVKCAMKDRDAVPGETEKEKDAKVAKDGVAFPPEMIGGAVPPESSPENQAVTNAPPGDQQDQGDEEDQPEEPPDRKKLRKKGFKAPQKEEDEVSARLRRKPRDQGLRHRSYEKWPL